MLRTRAVNGIVLVALCGMLVRPAAAESTRAPASLASMLALPATSPAGVPAAFEPPSSATEAPALSLPSGDGGLLAKRDRGARTKPTRSRPQVPLTAERARILLRSLTVPGWGQITTGHPTAATVFGIAELSVWTSFTAFRIQEQLRRDAYVRMAHVLAGIDLRSRDEEFKRIVGSYLSSDEYNQLVVARDAANLYYDDPTAFQQYFDAHSLKGKDTWAWPDADALLRYRGQRKDAQRAALRANAALAVAVANRLLSAIHAARLHNASSVPSHSWELEATPEDQNPTAFRVGVRTRF